MQNSSSTQDYGCSSSPEIPCILENLKGDDNYKTLHIKLWTQYSLYQYTNKDVCILCCRLRCIEQHTTHSYHEPNKKVQTSLPISFKRWFLHYPPKYPKWFLLLRVSKQLCNPIFFTICMLHALYIFFLLASIMVIISVQV